MVSLDALTNLIENVASKRSSDELTRLIEKAASSYYLRRIALAVFVLWATITLAFIIFRLLPSGPGEILRQRLVRQAQQGGRAVNMERINRLVELYTGTRPDRPLHLDYYYYMRDIILYQDFGRSIWHNEPVFDILFEKMPWSVFLSIYGLAIGRITGILLGAAMAYKEGSMFDSSLTVFTIVNRGIPYIFVAIFGLVIFGYNLGWFPTGGRANPNTVPGLNWPYITGLINHAFLPITTGIVASFGGGLAFRGNAIREMGEGYVKLAHLRGVAGGRIAIRYIGRNAFLPAYTSIMMAIPAIFSSSIIIETIFQYPAVGFATFGALTQRDYPLLMGAFIFLTFLTILGLLIADLTYPIIDPRAKTGGEREAF